MSYDHLIGRQIGLWKVLGPSTKRRRDGRGCYLECECQCEKHTRRAVAAYDLIVFEKGIPQRGSGSCGCLAGEKASKRLTKHGMVGHPAYVSWQNARRRCEEAKNVSYANYGGRGITMCDEWRNSFEAFWEHMGSTWKQGLTLDRYPDVNQGYRPGNCRWATQKQQGEARQIHVYVDTKDGRMMLAEAAEFYNIPYTTVQARRRMGWPEQDWFQPVRPIHRRIT